MNRWWLLAAAVASLRSAAPRRSRTAASRTSRSIGRPARCSASCCSCRGEQGWNAQLSRSAQLLASQGALVAGIDSRALFANLERDGAECVYPDGDLENLSHFLQAYYRLPSYEPAVLVGYGAGATLSYAMLAQAPAETFAGGDLDRLLSGAPAAQAPVRSGLAARRASRARIAALLVPDKLEAPWIVLQTRAARRVRHGCDAAIRASARRAARSCWCPQDANSANWEAALSAAVQRLDPPPRSTAAAAAGGARRPADRRSPCEAARRYARGPDLGRRRLGGHRQGCCCGARRARHRCRRRRFAALLLEGAHAAEHGGRRRSHPAPLHGGVGQERRGADRLFAGRRRPAVRRQSPAGADARARAPAAMLGLGERAVFEFRLRNWLSQRRRRALPIAPELQRMCGHARLVRLQRRSETNRRVRMQPAAHCAR